MQRKVLTNKPSRSVDPRPEPCASVRQQASPPAVHLWLEADSESPSTTSSLGASVQYSSAPCADGSGMASCILESNGFASPGLTTEIFINLCSCP